MGSLRCECLSCHNNHGFEQCTSNQCYYGHFTPVFTYCQEPRMAFRTWTSSFQPWENFYGLLKVWCGRFAILHWIQSHCTPATCSTQDLHSLCDILCLSDVSVDVVATKTREVDVHWDLHHGFLRDDWWGRCALVHCIKWFWSRYIH